ncbi:hypothetical protein GYM62_04980 [Algoriphagus sp. NBT04N3]|jgi:hypothetical protein|uniref:hypothetical protein n=1 Tax=Algoriphagus sp. NBT04N3 TaxID=2705473 RepID=UPI001C625525|nr:hypothetical protein [Algoriphagus sp. NBT04N3]QYH38181.1 hypothetical protein GYM62_04980 [Algoriphagus sp. NBT04N3]
MITEHKRGVIDFIKTIYLQEMDDLVSYPEAAYSKFLILIQGVEFLGACQDPKPFDSEESGLSKKRFRKGMVLLGEKYKRFLDDIDEISFYRDFRCPMVHQFKHNQKKISLATKSGVNNGDVHLKMNENGQLYIVLEDFYQDIKTAAMILINQIEAGEYTITKLSEPYLTIHSIDELRIHTT